MSCVLSHSVVSNSATPWTVCSLPGSSLGKNTGVGCHALFQGISPTQESSPGLLHWRWILYQLSYQGGPKLSNPLRAIHFTSQSAFSWSLMEYEYHTSSSHIRRLLGWLSGKGYTCQCRRLKRLRFNPWVRKIPWRGKWQPTQESHEQKNLAGYSPQGRKESDMTGWAHTHTHTQVPYNNGDYVTMYPTSAYGK